MEKPSTLLAGNPKIVYMVPRPGRSERTPVKRTVVPLAMLNLVASAATNQLFHTGTLPKTGWTVGVQALTFR